jgi:hypothetical protein
VADTPALPERLSDGQVDLLASAPLNDAVSPETAIAVRLAREVRDLRRASPRREAPADAVEALAAAMEEHAVFPPTWAAYRDASPDWQDLAADLIAAGYQLVPADHHVSRVGHVWKDGRLWRVEIHVEDDGSERVCPRAYLRPVGTEEADTDERG